jgi:hypothetical protein
MGADSFLKKVQKVASKQRNLLGPDSPIDRNSVSISRLKIRSLEAIEARSVASTQRTNIVAVDNIFWSFIAAGPYPRCHTPECYEPWRDEATGRFRMRCPHFSWKNLNFLLVSSDLSAGLSGLLSFPPNPHLCTEAYPS